MSDKRSVATDALEVLGKKITDKKVGRDAVHLACLPVICGDEVIAPGDDIGIDDDGTASTGAAKLIGIADPFIKGYLKKGDEFLLIIYPRTIESLRHVWSHPDVPEEPTFTVATPNKSAKEVALEKLRAIAMNVIPDAEESRGPLELLIDGMEYGSVCDGYRFEGYGRVNIPDEAWDLYEIAFGKRASYEPNKEDVYFSCSC